MITKLDLLRVFLRSFFIQSLWNLEGLQNAGFLYTISPCLDRLYPGKDDRKMAYIRHLEPFNTHPYAANLIIGYTISKEEKGVEKDMISSLKKGMFGPLAVMGDAIFWAGIMPLFAFIASMMAIYGYVWGGVIFLLLYNLIHIPTRFLGLHLGYRLGDNIVEVVKRFRFKTLSSYLQMAQVIVCGLALGSIAGSEKPLPFYPFLIGILVFGLRRGMRPTLLFFIIVMICIAVSYLFGY